MVDIYQIFITHNRIWSIREAICFSTVMLFALALGMYLKQKKKVTMCQVISGLLALLFLGIVFGSTVFTRNPGTRKYELELFWSWKVIFGIEPVGKFPSENPGLLLQENVLNMFLLMPFGMLLPFIFKRRIAAWKGLLAGVIISTTIELLQLVFCRGLFEFDDIVHNSIGCMAGCILAGRTFTMWKRRKK